MAKIYSKALDKHLYINRFIGKIKGAPTGPTLIFMAGIHGNEPAGVFALQIILEKLTGLNHKINGNIYCISGNLGALEKGIRFQDQDLNRMWNADQITSLENGLTEIKSADTREQISIHQTLQEILNHETGPFYFMDLHTTSSETIPFLTVNDSILNRKYTAQYPLPIILGIEEYLEGPLLSYINTLGYVAFGFEGGQHDALASIENHVSFVYLSLVYTGVLHQSEIDYFHHYELLAKHTTEKQNIYEINFRFEIKPGDNFEMNHGFVNFQRIKRNQPLAKLNGRELYAKTNGRILMPQYQNLGNDGFFTIKKTSAFFIRLSALVRKLKADYLLTLLPGIQWASKNRDAILVNKTIARFYAKQIFHLFGYRSRTLNQNLLLMKNRELPSRAKEYNL